MLVRVMRSHVAFALALSALASARSSRAEENAPTATTPPFTGRAIYVGLGAGALPTAHVATENWRAMATLPLAPWSAIEIFPFGYHFVGPGAAQPEDAYALGIGLGFRVAPWPNATIRPHLSTRVSHVHFWPDPWGESTTDAGTTTSTSNHRWGAALGGGFDAPIGGRFRAGIDLEASVLSGPPGPANLGLAGLADIGFAL